MTQIARRTVIAGAGAGIAAGLVGEAAAQSKPKPKCRRANTGRTRAA